MSKTLQTAQLVAVIVLLPVVDTAHTSATFVTMSGNYDCAAQADIPTIECKALVALYDSTDGSNWKNNQGWLSTSPCTWSGVKCLRGSVHTVDMPSNDLQGSIPMSIGNLTKLAYLDLRNNRLAGQIPADVGKLHHLYWLFLSNNRLSGPIPAQLGDLPNLNWLNLGQNQLDGSIPPELGNLAKLEVAQLDNNELSGPILSQIANLAALRSLSLSYNQLTGPIPSELGKLRNLRYFSVFRNRLVGEIPAELGDLPNLEVLLLSYNELSGPIPAALARLYNLQRLRLDGNQLSGSIPAAFASMDSLLVMYLGDNNLTGSIPIELTDMSRLEYLYLSGNQLTGTIPKELSKLVGLEGLGLGRNRLSGSIPPDLANLENLEFLYLDDNNLTGTIDLGVARVGASASLCSFGGNEPSLCLPDIQSYRALGDLVCGLSLIPTCEPILHLLSPEAGATDVPTTTTLKWSDLGPGVRYDIQVSSNKNFAAVVFALNLPQSETEFVAPVAEHTYYWRVRAVVDGNEYGWSTPAIFKIGDSGPLVPKLEFPADESSHVSVDLDFRWSEAPDAESNIFQISEHQNFTPTLVNVTGVTMSRYRVTDLHADRRYYWRVAGVGNDHKRTFTRPFVFATGTAGKPAAMILSSPPDGSTNLNPVVTLRWKTATGASRYNVQVFADSAQGQLEFSHNTPGLYAVFNDPNPGQTRYWRVQPVSATGRSPFTSTWSFKTAAIDAAAKTVTDLPTEFALHSSYPNPFNPTTTISFDLPEAANVRLVIFDALGRVVESLADGRWSAGSYTVRWDATDVPSGVYFVWMKAGAFLHSRKILLLR